MHVLFLTTSHDIASDVTKHVHIQNVIKNAVGWAMVKNRSVHAIVHQLPSPTRTELLLSALNQAFVFELFVLLDFHYT